MAEKTELSPDNKIDWNEMSEIFDRWLPYLQPVAEALIDLADISEDDRILDVAAGTGEPSLTLARRYRNGNITIVGVDSAIEMVKRARTKAEKEGLSHLSFQEMSAEDLDFLSGSFDRVISRFGLMLFDNPLRGLEEIRRVLRHEGKLALAVWSEFHKLPSMALIWELLMKALPPEHRPQKPRISDLGTAGALESLFKSAGFEDCDIKPFKLSYRFDNFESYWSVSTDAGFLKAPLDLLSPEAQQQLKKEVELLTASYQENGELVFENEALLVLAEKF